MSQNDTVKIQKKCKYSDAQKTQENEHQKHQSKITRHSLSWSWLEYIFACVFPPLAF